MSASPARDSRTRTALIDAANRLILEEGYAAVTTRKVAAKAGVNQSLVYYYFRTMDELFLAAFRRGAEANLKRLETAARDEQPLRALWRISSQPLDSALTVEFIALANHRPAIRAELASYTRRFRLRQQEIIEQARATGEVGDTGGPSSAAVVVLAAALARILAMDGMLGITDGHDEVLALIEDNLARLCREQPGTDTSDDPGLP